MSEPVDVFPDVIGVLAEWLVDDGATVAEGDHIANLESMKTYFPVYAPCSGTLRYKVDTGEIAGQEEPLAQVEPTDA